MDTLPCPRLFGHSHMPGCACPVHEMKLCSQTHQWWHTLPCPAPYLLLRRRELKSVRRRGRNVRLHRVSCTSGCDWCAHGGSLGRRPASAGGAWRPAGSTVGGPRASAGRPRPPRRIGQSTIGRSPCRAAWGAIHQALHPAGPKLAAAQACGDAKARTSSPPVLGPCSGPAPSTRSDPRRPAGRCAPRTRKSLGRPAWRGPASVGRPSRLARSLGPRTMSGLAPAARARTSRSTLHVHCSASAPRLAATASGPRASRPRTVRSPPTHATLSARACAADTAGRRPPGPVWALGPGSPPSRTATHHGFPDEIATCTCRRNKNVRSAEAQPFMPEHSSAPCPSTSSAPSSSHAWRTLSSLDTATADCLLLGSGSGWNSPDALNKVARL